MTDLRDAKQYYKNHVQTWDKSHGQGVPGWKTYLANHNFRRGFDD